MHTTVKQLIEKLNALPADALALVDGYEGGFADIGTIKKNSVALNVHKEDYYGPHEQTNTANTPAIIIGRASNPNAG